MSQWRPRRENVDYFRRFLALAQAHCIDVYWILPTYSPGMQARREQTGQDAVYRKFVRQIQSEFPTVVMVDGQHMGLDRMFYEDHNHLCQRGAETMSQALAEALAKQQQQHERTHWVKLEVLGSSKTPQAITQQASNRVAR
jgi:hypothetical protein